MTSHHSELYLESKPGLNVPVRESTWSINRLLVISGAMTEDESRNQESHIEVNAPGSVLLPERVA